MMRGGLLVALLALAGCKPATIEEETMKLEAAERSALEAVFAAAGVRAEEVRPVGELGIVKNARSVAIEGGRVVGLRLEPSSIASLHEVAKLGALRILVLAGGRIADASPLAGHRELRTLGLAGNALEKIALAGLPRLEQLDVSRNRLRTLDGLADLPALEKFDASGNRLVDAGALAALPSLREVDLAKNQLATLPRAPQWKLSADGNPATAPAPAAANHVERLPKVSRKKLLGASHRGSQHGGRLGFEGRYETFEGAAPVPLVDSQGTPSDVTLEVSVEGGAVRGYLAEEKGDGYRLVEAAPGAPGRVAGRLLLGAYGHDRKFEIFLESVGGPARGVAYRVTR